MLTLNLTVSHSLDPNAQSIPDSEKHVWTGQSPIENLWPAGRHVMSSLPLIS